MKTILIALAATVFGCAIGFSLTWWELSSAGSEGLASPVDSLHMGFNQQTGSGRDFPRLEIVGGTNYDFGTMEKGATLSHAFIFKNEGTAPLTLAKGETSCKCTLSDLASGELAPGDSTEVRLEWTPKAYETGFAQTAEIHTNDPAQRIVSLSIEGRVIQSVRPAPESLALGSIALNETSTGELRLFSYPQEPIEITQIAWGDPELAPYFSAEIEPMPADELQTDPDAKTGKLVTIRIKPGLPLGPINQKIRLTTNFPDIPIVEVPLVATVTGDISVVGRGYVTDTSTLMLGRIKSEQGQSVKLNLLVKGDHGESTEIEVAQVEPHDVLQVTLGEKKALKQGAVYLIPLEITIAAGSRTVNHIGPRAAEQGKIVLTTNHPEVKQIPIHVRFAVE